MRIGIICFWGVPNYGAWAQAYALNNTLRQLTENGCIIEHLAYLHPNHFKSYYEKDERLYRSFCYSYDCIPHTRAYTSQDLINENFDVLITGSDAIWDFTIPSFGCDKFLVGNDIKSDLLISYAASCGVMTVNDDLPEFFVNGLKKYDNISVRDKNSFDIIKKITGNEPEIVLDPTLIWDLKNDINVKETSYSSYILVYGFNFDTNAIEQIKKFASEKNLRIISVGYINEWCDMSLRLIELRGLEWIGMFKNADYVFTNLFHGFMLSISFNKQVFFFSHDYVKKRSEYLINKLGLSHYYNDVNECVKKVLDDPLDYDKINQNLEQLKKKSLMFLKKELKIDAE